MKTPYNHYIIYTHIHYNIFLIYWTKIMIKLCVSNMIKLAQKNKVFCYLCKKQTNGPNFINAINCICFCC